MTEAERLAKALDKIKDIVTESLSGRKGDVDTILEINDELIAAGFEPEYPGEYDDEGWVGPLMVLHPNGVAETADDFLARVN